jgi:hypothetical protein
VAVLPFHTSTPFHPVIDGLAEYLGIERGASEAEVAARLKERAPAVWEDGAHDFDDMVKIVSRLVSPGEATGETMRHDTIAVRRLRPWICSARWRWRRLVASPRDGRGRTCTGPIRRRSI